MESLKSLKEKFVQLRTSLSPTKKADAILEDLKNLATSRPHDMRIQIKMADVLYKNGEIEQAINTLRSVAHSYEQQNFGQKSIAIYKKMIMMNPNAPEINLDLALTYEKLSMPSDAVIQYRIALQHFFNSGDKDKIIATTKRIAELDSSLQNKRRLAEIYQTLGMMTEALQEFEDVASLYRQQKQFDELLKLYEIILPHKPRNNPLIRDICILYLRKQLPDQAIKTMERYKVDADSAFTELYEKAKLMKKALRNIKNPAT